MNSPKGSSYVVKYFKADRGETAFEHILFPHIFYKAIRKRIIFQKQEIGFGKHLICQ